MSETLSDATLMSTLAGAASTFVAILAGFYTTKIFTITTDKRRIENKMAQLSLELQAKRENMMMLSKRLEEIRNEQDDDWWDSVFDYLKRRLHDKPQYFKSFAEVIEYLNKLDIFLYDRVLRRIEKKSESIIKELNEITEEIRRNQNKDLHYAFLPPSSDTTRIIESDRSMEKKRVLISLEKDWELEGNQITILEDQLDLHDEQLSSIAYPKLIAFGLIAFTLFAVLGVMIPLTHKWWEAYINQYFDTDIFAIIMFGIGLTITFIYIYVEIYFIFKKRK